MAQQQLYLLPLPTFSDEVKGCYRPNFLIGGISSSFVDSFYQVFQSGKASAVIVGDFHFGDNFGMLPPKEKLYLLYKELLEKALLKKDILLFIYGAFAPILRRILREGWVEQIAFTSGTLYDVFSDPSLKHASVDDFEKTEKAIQETFPIIIQKGGNQKEYSFLLNERCTLCDWLREAEALPANNLLNDKRKMLEIVYQFNEYS